MTRFVRISVSALALLAMTGPMALAADYDPPIFVEDGAEVPVEIGSGWYLRGDLGYNFENGYEDFELPSGYHERSNQLFGGVGIGYHFNDFLRADLNLGILSGNRFGRDFTTVCGGTETVTTVNTVSGATVTTNDPLAVRPCDGSDNGRNEAFDLMANAYVDLGTYAGFTPYLGAGAGLAYTTYRSALNDRECEAQQIVTAGGNTTTTTTFLCTGQTAVTDPSVTYDGTVESDSQIGFAWALNAGFAYQMTKNASLDFGYQYLSLPGAKFVAVDGGGLQTIQDDLDYHQFKIGLRYDLW